MKKMVALLAVMMTAMSVSVWAAEDAAPAQAEASAPANVEAKPADKRKKPAEKMRGTSNCPPDRPYEALVNGNWICEDHARGSYK